MNKPVLLFVLVAILSFWQPAQAQTESFTPMQRSEHWLVGAMKAWVSPSDHKIHGETPEQAEDRYRDMASDALAVAFSDDEKPLFDGPYGRQRTSLLMLAIARWESNYIKRIDDGECLKGECDNGRAACIMQVHTTGGLVLEKDTYSIASNSKSKEWRAQNAEKILTGDSLRDRRTCFKAALHKMRESIMACRGMPNETRLGIYTGEGCSKDKPAPKSATRIRTADWYFRKLAPPSTDSEIQSMANVD